MGRWRDGMKERKCGCLFYEYGPPKKCPKHETKHREKEEKTLRQLVSEQADSLGHDMTRWEEYESKRGKWTAFCHHCGLIAIVYDEPQPAVDQVIGHVLTRACHRSPLVEEPNHGTQEQAAEMV